MNLAEKASAGYAVLVESFRLRDSTRTKLDFRLGPDMKGKFGSCTHYWSLFSPLLASGVKTTELVVETSTLATISWMSVCSFRQYEIHAG